MKDKRGLGKGIAKAGVRGQRHKGRLEVVRRGHTLGTLNGKPNGLR